jgi:hypothetical protein
METVISCLRCKQPLNRMVWNTHALVSCPACRSQFQADVYPAAERPVSSGAAGQAVQTDKEAGCFYHPRKKAILPCSTCGRFLCALCDIEFNGAHLCPQCFEKGKADRKIQGLENRRVCYDKIALYVALSSMLLYWLSLLSAPIVLFMTVRYWKTPRSIVSRSKIRWIAAAGLAGIQLLLWGLMFYGLAGHGA